MRLREVVRDNILRIKAQLYPPGVKYSERGFAGQLGLAPTTLRNLLLVDSGTSIDTLQTIADRFGFPAWHLMVEPAEVSSLAANAPPTPTAAPERKADLPPASKGRRQVVN